jgi:Uncharacterized protein conserved in bacteria
MSLLRTAAAALAALMLLTACGKQAEPSWRVSDVHMNAMPPGQTRAAVYLKLENPAPRERMIQYVATPIAGTAEVHRHFYEDGMMKMRAVPHARVAAQSTLEFKPGGYHIMLLDVAEAPEVGSRFPLTFEFDGGERLEVEVEVRPR